MTNEIKFDLEFCNFLDTKIDETKMVIEDYESFNIPSDTKQTSVINTIRNIYDKKALCYLVNSTTIRCDIVTKKQCWYILFDDTKTCELFYILMENFFH